MGYKMPMTYAVWQGTAYWWIKTANSGHLITAPLRGGVPIIANANEITEYPSDFVPGALVRVVQILHGM